MRTPAAKAHFVREGYEVTVEMIIEEYGTYTIYMTYIGSGVSGSGVSRFAVAIDLTAEEGIREFLRQCEVVARQ